MEWMWWNVVLFNYTILKRYNIKKRQWKLFDYGKYHNEESTHINVTALHLHCMFPFFSHGNGKKRITNTPMIKNQGT